MDIDNFICWCVCLVSWLAMETRFSSDTPVVPFSPHYLETIIRAVISRRSRATAFAPFRKKLDRFSPQFSLPLVAMILYSMILILSYKCSIVLCKLLFRILLRFVNYYLDCNLRLPFCDFAKLFTKWNNQIIHVIIVARDLSSLPVRNVARLSLLILATFN